MKIDPRSALIGALLCCVVMISTAAGLREKYHQRFGAKIVEAVTLTCLDEFNRNRAWHSRPMLTTNDMVQAVMQTWKSLPSYDSEQHPEWLDDGQ